MEKSNTTFNDLGLRNWLVKAASEVGIVHPTSIQEKTIPAVLQGKHVIGGAHTGSGKTAAFALPIIHDLANDPFGIFCIILTPTRELAIQIADQIKVFTATMTVDVALLIGGMDFVKQALDLKNYPHFIVATPGRLASLLETPDDETKTALNNVKYLVLDEADRFVNDDCFLPDLKIIYEQLPKERQTLLFSATINEKMENRYDILEGIIGEKEEDKQPEKEVFTCNLNIDIRHTIAGLDQKYILVPESTKEIHLIHFLRKMMGPEHGIRSCIIFASTIEKCNFLKSFIDNMDLRATCIHSLLTLKKRMKNLFMFKAERIQILVATDLASRGLDIPTVDLVVNFDVPVEPVDYVHRTGRTARAGRGGLAVSFVTQFDVKLIYSIEEYAGVSLEEIDEKLQASEDKVLEDMPYMSKVMQSIRIRISEGGFEEKLENYRKQKHNFKGRQKKVDPKKRNKLGFMHRKRKSEKKQDGNKRAKVEEIKE